MYRIMWPGLLLLFVFTLFGCRPAVEAPPPTPTATPTVTVETAVPERQTLIFHADYIALSRAEMIAAADAIFRGRITEVGHTEWNQDGGQYWEGGMPLHRLEVELRRSLVDELGLGQTVTITVGGKSPVDDVVPLTETTELGGQAEHNLSAGMEVILFVQQREIAWRDGQQAVITPVGRPGDAYDGAAAWERVIEEVAEVRPLTTGEEAILILEPGPGSRVTSPARVAGVADPTFEQSLTVSLLLEDGSELAIAPAQIEADLGERGPFAVEIPFTVEGEQQAFIQVYAISARDGGVTHLSSVGLIIADSGPENVIPVTPHRERIAIYQPLLGDTISGGVARVIGFGIAGFEQTLHVEALDADGHVVGSHWVMVQAPDLGQPGLFMIELPYTVDQAGPGRIVVRDGSPAFGGDAHLASVEITLAP